MLEHLNRMRMDPQGELDVLFESLNPLVSPDPAVNAALDYFNDPTSEELLADWAALVPIQPVAWHSSLYDAAYAHNLLLIEHDTQSHQLPGEDPVHLRVESAGYTNWSWLGENVYSWAQSVFHCHSAFAIDWGVESRGHRNNMMNGTHREIGISIVPETDLSTSVGPLVVTTDYGSRSDMGNSYLLGVVYDDANGNGRYDAGEGAGGQTIEVSGPAGTFTTTTLSAGGYQLQVPVGTYTVTATGSLLAEP